MPESEEKATLEDKSSLFPTRFFHPPVPGESFFCGTHFACQKSVPGNCIGIFADGVVSPRIVWKGYRPFGDFLMACIVFR